MKLSLGGLLSVWRVLSLEHGRLVSRCVRDGVGNTGGGTIADRRQKLCKLCKVEGQTELIRVNIIVLVQDVLAFLRSCEQSSKTVVL